jgi:hypothetical protein
MNRKTRKLKFPEGVPGMKVEQNGDLVYLYLDGIEMIKMARMMMPPTLVGQTKCGTSEVWVYRLDEAA